MTQIGIKTNKNESENLSDLDNDEVIQPRLKVVVLTVICSYQMQYNEEIWEEIK